MTATIITIPGLDPQYRLYRTDSGRYIRVKVEVMEALNEDQAEIRTYKMTAEEADASGLPLALAMPAFTVTQMLSEVAEPAVTVVTDFPAEPTAGLLVIKDSVLYEADGTLWNNRGSIDEGASAGFAEVLAMLDRYARIQVDRAERSFVRRAGDAEIMTALGSAV